MATLNPIINDAWLKRLESDGTDRIYRDRHLTGFAVRVKPNGTTTYIVDLRVKGGKMRRKTIGQPSSMDAGKARAEAMTIIGAMKGGVDVVAVERSAESLPTLQQVLDGYVGSHELKQSTQDEYQSLLDTHLACWADTPIDEIKPGAVKDLHRSIGSPSRANASMRVLRALWNYAWADNLDEGGNPRLAGKNPVDVLSGLGQWNKTKAKTRHLTTTQYPTWHQAVAELSDERCTGRSEVVRDLFNFLVLTGIRRSEALRLTDEDVDLKAAAFVLVDTKNGLEHPLPASTSVLEILKRRCGNGHLFPISDSSLPRYYKMIAKDCGVFASPHDLRRTFATHARNIGIDKRTIGEMLNHKTGRDITGDYITPSAEPFREPMQKISDHFAGLLR